MTLTMTMTTRAAVEPDLPANMVHTWLEFDLANALRVLSFPTGVAFGMDDVLVLKVLNPLTHRIRNELRSVRDARRRSHPPARQTS